MSPISKLKVFADSERSRPASRTGGFHETQTRLAVQHPGVLLVVCLVAAAAPILIKVSRQHPAPD
jgi:hypothetical protein